MDEWKVCIHDRFPAYITWERYERNIERLASNMNRPNQPGAVRSGPALVQGLVRCGRCGYMMATRYMSGRGKAHPRYCCHRPRNQTGEGRCQSLSAGCLDRLVAEQVLVALTPSALDVSLKAAADVERQREQVAAIWDKRVERCRYAVERAARQYHAVEPENRLVARSLEGAWESALRELSRTKEEHRRQMERQPRGLTDAERRAIRTLATDLPALWSAESTIDADRKAIIRLLVEQVDVAVVGETELVDVTLKWVGGHETRHRIERPVGRLKQLSRYDELRARLIELRQSGLGGDEIAEVLNSEGWRTAQRQGLYNGRLIRHMFDRHGPGIPKGRPRPPGEDTWWLMELAHELDVSRSTVYGWLKRGVLDAHQLETHRRAWVIRADAAEIDRLRAYRDRPFREKVRKQDA